MNARVICVRQVFELEKYFNRVNESVLFLKKMIKLEF